MPFGGFSPLPLRLGADPERGWSAGAQSRLAADLVAVKRTLPFCVMTFDASTMALITYVSQAGSGPDLAPYVASLGLGRVGLDWEAAYQDYAEVFYPFKVRAARVSVTSELPIARSVEYYPASGYDLEIHFRNLATSLGVNPVFTITVWGDWLPERQIGDYDGATDKTDSLTEGDSSYCYDWFLELRAMRGSAYSKAAGNVDAENFAIARQLGAISRNAEKLEANSLPGTSDEKLENWATILGISNRQNEQRWQLRQRCEAKLKAATSKASPSNIDDAVRTLLGDTFVAAHRITGATLEGETTATYWVGGTPGEPSYSLGGGAWYSDRSFYWVEVQQPPSANDAAFSRLMSVDFFELLDLRLPAHMTFGWATSDGFIVDSSLLDFAAIGTEP